MKPYEIIMITIGTLTLLAVLIGWLITTIRNLNDQINRLSASISGQNAIQLAYKEDICDLKKITDDHEKRIQLNTSDIRVLKEVIK